MTRLSSHPACILTLRKHWHHTRGLRAERQGCCLAPSGLSQPGPAAGATQGLGLSVLQGIPNIHLGCARIVYKNTRKRDRLGSRWGSAATR